MRIVLIIAVAIAMLLAVILMWRKSASARTRPSDAEVMRTLRLRVLQGDAASISKPTDPHEPFVVIMDMGMENGTASVISASTGDASIYLSIGGGIIGGIGHESSRAAIAFVREAAAHLSARVGI